MRTRGIYIFTGIILIICAIGANAELQPIKHNGLYLGFGIGFGGGQIKLDNFDASSNRENGLSINLRIGGSLNPQVLLGAEIDAWRKEENGVAIQFNNYAACISYYVSQGFFIKGGPALSIVAAEAYGSSDSESGSGFTIGTGYEIRTGSKFALVPSFQYIYQDMDGYSTNFYSLLLNFNWFW